MSPSLAIPTPLRRATARLAGDPHVLLTMAVALAALSIELASGVDARFLVLPVIGYLAIQFGITLAVPAGHRSQGFDTVRLLIALGAVLAMGMGTGAVASLPLAPLYIPIVTMAAAIGWRPTLIVGAAAFFAYLGPTIALSPDGQLTDGTVLAARLQRGVSLVAATVVLVIGTRRTVSSLERAVSQARSAMAASRRRGRQMAAVEAVGRLLATQGPSAAALDDVMELLVTRFDYRYVSIYTVEGELLRLGAQRGYAEPVHTFPLDKGVVGRVVRTGQPALVRDIHADPDYHAADPDIRFEVSVPLLSEGRVIGVLNVESTASSPLDESDRDLMLVVADRVAAAIQLGRERQALRERAALFTRLADFSTAVNASLDSAKAHQAIVAGVATALETDIVALVLRDIASGEDRIAAMHGGDQRFVGVSIPKGEGVAGKALASGELVHVAALDRSDFPTTVQNARSADTVAAAAMPLIGDDGIVGALSLSRTDLSRPHSALELEALALIASQVVLLLNNIALHTRMADAAVRDPLTGLWNRRHLDVSLSRLFAVRDRQAPEDRHPVAAILFDLDHFGAFNKQHGHATGDAVLRAFGAILGRRLRSSDLVARFGGEEFVAILDGASLDEARRVADEIRRELEAVRVEGADGEQLRATVSAGCSSLGPDVTSFETLLEVADVGLQMAKRGGRNQVVAA